MNGRGRFEPIEWPFRVDVRTGEGGAHIGKQRLKLSSITAFSV